MKYILTLDQGTTSSRALLVDEASLVAGTAQYEFPQIFPKPGWVEHDPWDILNSQMRAAHEVIGKTGVSINDIKAMAITNQRETAIVWDAETGKPVYNAVVWQCRRTASICDALTERGLAPYIQESTGLVVDAYFSATKIAWILQNVPGARERAREGKLRFGTVDTWLLWNLTGGKVHATDYSNAARTMLFDINRREWDETLLSELDIPRSMLPEVKDSSGFFGMAELDGVSIPLMGIAGDQNAALFGQTCFDEGSCKNTYGTGCFILMNTGEKRIRSSHNLLSTIAWSVGSKPEYALEGSVFNAGAAIQWLRDGLRLIESAPESDRLALEVPDNGGVYFVPAFTGLGAPYWDMYARGSVLGLSRGTTKEHIARAVLESICFQSRDIFDAMEKDTGVPLRELNIDGGASASPFIPQFQADILGINVVRPVNIESTAMGAAYLAGLAAGVWQSKDELRELRGAGRVFRPKLNKIERERLYKSWQKAVGRSRDWIER